MTGSKLGLFIPQGVTAANVQAICEGESDTAAALTLGIPAIGVPGAGNAIQEAAKFIGACPVACPCIIADNDASGQNGAKRLAPALNQSGIPCRILTPPSPHGDLREWLCNGDLTKDQLLAAVGTQEIIWPERTVPGFMMVPNELLRSGTVAKLGAGPVALALLLKSFDCGNGKVRPGRDTLGKLMGVSVGTIDRYKVDLKESGLIDWKRGGPGWASEYCVNLGPLREQKRKKI